MYPVFQYNKLNQFTHMPFILNAEEDVLVFSKKVGNRWLPHFTRWEDEADGAHPITLAGYAGGACNPCARYANGLFEVSFVTEGKDGYQLDYFKGHTLRHLTLKTQKIRAGIWSGFVYGGVVGWSEANQFHLTRAGVTSDYVCEVDMIWRLVAHPEDAGKVIISAEKDGAYCTQIFDMDTGAAQGIDSFYKGIVWKGETIWCEKSVSNYQLHWQAQSAPTAALFNIQEV